MSSFYAELEVAGQTYPARQCPYDFEQPAGERGRVLHGLLQHVLDMPNDAVERAPLLAQHAALEATLRDLAPMHNALRAG